MSRGDDGLTLFQTSKEQREQPNVLFMIGGKTQIEITVKNVGQVPEAC